MGASWANTVHCIAMPRIAKPNLCAYVISILNSREFRGFIPQAACCRIVPATRRRGSRAALVKVFAADRCHVGGGSQVDNGFSALLRGNGKKSFADAHGARQKAAAGIAETRRDESGM